MKLVDTSAWIEYIRGTGSDTALQVNEMIVSGEAAWCDLAAVELWNGVSERQQSKLIKLERLIVPLAINQSVWLHARKLANAARSNGLTIPVTDIVVAACAHIHQASIEHHRDEHFDMLSRLLIL